MTSSPGPNPLGAPLKSRILCCILQSYARDIKTGQTSFTYSHARMSPDCANKNFSRGLKIVRDCGGLRLRRRRGGITCVELAHSNEICVSATLPATGEYVKKWGRLSFNWFMTVRGNELDVRL